MLVQNIKEVPDFLFFPALEEIEKINFSNEIDSRSNYSVFKTSKAIHLRIHKPPVNGPSPKTIEEWSVITECINNDDHYDFYPKIIDVCNWISLTVEGLNLGRIMIVNLESKGIIKLHKDPLNYFEKFSRFHVAFKTNKNVVFKDENNVEEHMPYKTLCRLNNRLLHAVENKSLENRIHLIVDVEQKEGNRIF